MVHPFLSMNAHERIWLSIITLAITVTGITVLGLEDPGRVSGKGVGIVGFELAGNASRANTILESWGEAGRRVAAFNLGFDYLFILGYSSFAALMCLQVGNRNVNPGLFALGVLLAWLQWAAGLLDCTENAFLLAILFHGASDGAAQIARWSALAKFGLLACGAIYILFSLFWKTVGRTYGRV